ncbi:hypothetical protein EDD27_5371 [Nonomuraea polychroma]|uniref:WD40 repeat protein n=1 Tax=Nonomuraea polychroma TaxID=46176 RepID=A0A438MAG5_9ACTN|nr:hypothetical protein [Nonomuraea polychroma]RVX42722.1 hypothetical protein EDD27_5371 [Nonomuraea polychroma]
MTDRAYSIRIATVMGHASTIHGLAFSAEEGTIATTTPTGVLAI